MWKLVAAIALAAGVYYFFFSAPTPTYTYTPPPPDASEQIYQTASPRCADAFAGGAPAGLPAPGSVPGPAVGLVIWDKSQLATQYQETSPWFMNWRPVHSIVPARARAASADGVQTLVCMRDTYVQVGTYDPGNVPALRVDSEVRLVRWPSGEMLASAKFQGPDPPKSTETTSTSSTLTVSGGNSRETETWLDGLFAR